MNHEPEQQPKGQKLHGAEVAKHNNDKDCWVIIHGRAYDVTEFKNEHPGGKSIILKYAGKDATETYDPIHPPDTLDKYLEKDKHLGEVDMSTIEKEQINEDPDEQDRQERVRRMPTLEQCYNLMDFGKFRSLSSLFRSLQDGVLSCGSCSSSERRSQAPETGRSSGDNTLTE